MQPEKGERSLSFVLSFACLEPGLVSSYPCSVGISVCSRADWFFGTCLRIPSIHLGTKDFSSPQTFPRASISVQTSSHYDPLIDIPLGQFVLMDNAEVQELPEGVFRDLSFQDIWVNYTALRRIHPSALLPSKDSLETVSIRFSDLESFPFNILPQFSRLKELSLWNNSLTSVPAIQSDSLEILNLPYNNLANVGGPGWATPNLRELYLSYNPTMKFPTEVIRTLGSLEKFWCSGCNLGPVLRSGLMDFRSSALRQVWLKENGISKLERAAMTGLTPDTTVILSWNRFRVLDESIIRPMLEVMSEGEGCLYLETNPVKCDCGLTWLAFSYDLLRNYKGTCEDGTDFKNLEQMPSVKNCRTCPYDCVSGPPQSHCKAGEIFPTKENKCITEEACGKLVIPRNTTPRTARPRVCSCPAPGGLGTVTRHICSEPDQACCRSSGTAKTSGSTTGEETNGEVKENGEANEEVCLCPDTDGYSCVEANVAVCDPGSVIHFACPKYTQVCCRPSTIRRKLVPLPSPVEVLPCPSSHGCLDPGLRKMCKPGSEVQKTECNGKRICCAIDMASVVIPPALPPCPNECVSPNDVDSCDPETVKKETKCSEKQEYCCKTKTPSSKETLATTDANSID
ncbi:unnamed protein product [Darwinula stevensoni]|uniref:Uncharacterized protein n=1 Tax=Darwinula stevensoni TaxID=69355 RepID=A0A7R8X7Q6_9CRUS|nr:unnamed protein product [Darwinula stevensoni]CAG0887972.1 unnamed protein product [Darwinula stevensoni]